MWILEASQDRSAEDLADDLNSHLLDKHDNPKRFGPILLEEQLTKEQGNARLWRIQAILDHRVEIYYPGQIEELHAKLSAESIIDGMRHTELDNSREAESRLFDIADTTGPEALIASVVTLRDTNTKSEDEWQKGLARLAGEVRKAMARNAA